MIVKYVSSGNELKFLIDEMKSQGLHCAAISNTGLQGTGMSRVTFLPKSAFVKGSEQNP